MFDSVRPHRRQPTRLCRPWDSPGKNTGVGCHFTQKPSRALLTMEELPMSSSLVLNTLCDEWRIFGDSSPWGSDGRVPTSPRTWARKAPVLSLAPQRATSITNFCERACRYFYQLAICVVLGADMAEPTILNICSRK